MKIKLYTFALKTVMRIHNFLYKLMSYLSIKREGGLHPKYRLIKYKDFFLENIKPEDTILDIGCGKGALAYDLSRKASYVVGIDVVCDKIEYAKKHYKGNNVEFICADATKDLSNEKFDVIVMSNVLEHIEDRVGFMKNIKHLAKKYLIRVPMVDRDWVPLYKKELNIEWRLDLTHFTEFTYLQFKEELENSGYFIEKYSVQFGEIWAVTYIE